MNSELIAAKEKLEIVSGAAPPPFWIFAGGFFRKNAFGLISEYCDTMHKKSPSSFIRKNLEVQGFLCDAPQFGAVEPWLRFNPTVCFLIAAAGLYLGSSTLFFVLAVFAAIGVSFPHTLADMAYNYGIRFITGTPPLPKNPAPRRFACFVGMMWSISIMLAFTYGYTLAAHVLGIILLLVIVPMIVWHYCIASVIYQTIFARR